MAAAGSQSLCFVSRVFSSIQNYIPGYLIQDVCIFPKAYTCSNLSFFCFFFFNTCQTLLKTIWHMFRIIINTKSNVGSPASELLRFFLFCICVIYTGREVEAIRISFLLAGYGTNTRTYYFKVYRRRNNVKFVSRQQNRHMPL